MLSVTHASAERLRMNGFGPLARRRREFSDGLENVEILRVSGPQKDLSDVKREIRIDAGMGNIVEKSAVHETFRQKVFHGFKKPFVVFRKKVQRIPGRERADGACVHAPVRRSGHGLRADPRRGLRKAVFNRA